jgi:ATP-dependent DNA ligase
MASGTALFRAICELDMEGIVAKQAAGLYTPEATTWVKIKNRAYSQAVGRSDFFDRRRARVLQRGPCCAPPPCSARV